MLVGPLGRRMGISDHATICLFVVVTLCDTLVWPLGRLWVPMYLAILGVVWCGRVWSVIYEKMLLWECTMRSTW